MKKNHKTQHTKRGKNRSEEAKLFTVYKATSKTTGRCYVGCTALDLSQRMYLHQSASLPSPNRKSRRSTSAFHKAIAHLGFDDFEWQVLDSDTNEDFARNVLEPSYIDLEKAFTEGYNECRGGYGKKGYVDSTETLKKKRKATMERIAKGTFVPHDKRGWRVYTNGVRNKMLPPNRRPPAGFVRGSKLYTMPNWQHEVGT